MNHLVAFFGMLVLQVACSGERLKDTDSVDLDGDGFTAAEDCDDSNSAVHPEADEICDGLDNNCDAIIDEDAIDRTDWYVDADGDGFGDPQLDATAACEAPTGSVEDSSDCDDEQATVYPGAAEVCDGLDNDCNEQTDEDLDYYLTSVHLTMGSVSALTAWSVSYDDSGRLSSFQLDDIWTKSLEEFGFLDEDWVFSYDDDGVGFSGTTSNYNLGERAFMEGRLDTNGKPSFIKLDTERDGSFDPGEDYSYTYEWYDQEQYTYRGLDEDFDGVMDSDVANTYDADGRILHSVATSYSGTNMEWELIYSYDEHGTLIYASVDLHRDGEYELVFIYTHSYDEFGNRVASEYDNQGDGEIDWRETFVYDLEGHKLQHDMDSSGSGFFDRTETWLYDENDNVIVYTFSTDDDEDGEPEQMSVKLSTYDPLSRLLVYEEDSDGDGMPDYRESYTYDESLNSTTKDTDRDGDGTIEWQFSFVFNDNDDLTSALYSYLDEEQDNVHVTINYDAWQNRTQEAWDFEAETDALDTQFDYSYSCNGEPVPHVFAYEHFYEAEL